MEVISISEVESENGFESDILSLAYDNSVLIVVVELSEENSCEIIFGEQVWAFRYMEEGDLTYYWESGAFNGNKVLYEIKEGGWLSKEGTDLDILGIARSGAWLKEWLVVTKNHLLFVLSNSEPKIKMAASA